MSQKELRPNERRPSPARSSRRGFLRVAGGAATGAALFATGCDSTGGLSDNQDPVAAFSYAPAEAGGGLAMQFDASESEDPDGRVASYSWEFGDGTSQSGGREEAAVVTKNYASPGIYTVELSVVDQRGAIDKATEQVTVGTVDPGEGDVPLDFGNDAGVLNYAYALEQLEAAFYARVLQEGTFSGSTEAAIQSIAAHEDVHRLTLRQLLGSAAIRDLTPDFGAVSFGSARRVLETAQMLEALGVAAYNGAGHLLSNADFLAAAGSIVSVEARHAAAVRDLSDPADHFFSGMSFVANDFAIDENGFYEASDPRDVLEAAVPFIEENFDVRGL